MAESETPRGPRLKPRPHTTKGAIVFAIFTVASIAWRVFDAWSNLEFIGQKAGLFWRALHFLFATQTGANTLVVVFVALLVSSLLFQFERRSLVPGDDDSQTPATGDAHSRRSLVPQQENAEKPAPNLVDRGPRVFRAHQDVWTQVLVEGASDSRYSTFDPDWRVLTIEICNEFQVKPKTIPINDLTAEIKYTFPDDEDFKLNRGAWLGARNRIGLRVNDSGYLIIILSPMSYSPQTRVFTREYPRQEFIHLDSIMDDLPHGQDYPVEVKLVSESEGRHFGTLNYMLAVSKDGDVEFVKASDWDMFQDARAKAAVEEQQNDGQSNGE